MSEVKKFSGKTVFGLDIGTRSIVGTVGYKKGDEFYCIAQRIKEHKTRSMLDGQIHDIAQVGETILEVKRELEEAIDKKLSEVCIAAAGRVLRTVTVSAVLEFPEAKEVTSEDVYTLKSIAVEKAYESFTSQEKNDYDFYCVGNSVIHYYMNGYRIINPEGHKAQNISADLIATFLPEDVIDGLYKAVDYAGLRVANLTLEPIAAIQVAIPESYRMLNLALVDVGAGTSDICITEDGSITAYGMIPSAGDGLTEAIAKKCLVDFNMAEQIKRQAVDHDDIEYQDIIGLPQIIKKSDLLEYLEPNIRELAYAAADKILELNGDKPVSAVFVVGGGGKIPGYTQMLAEKLGIAEQRAVLRGKEVLGNVIYTEKEVELDSTLVTPIGICMNYYEQSNNFIIVTFNNKKIKLYDNDKLSVVDAALQADFPNERLFPRRGATLQFSVNKKARSVKGQLGEAAVIKIAGKEGNIYTPIHENDIIKVEESTVGAPGKLSIGELPGFRDIISVQVQDKRFDIPKYAKVNGAFQSAFYDIQQGDDIEILDYCTVGQLLDFMDIVLEPEKLVYVNHKPGDRDTKIYENYLVSFEDKPLDYTAYTDTQETSEPLSSEKTEKETPDDTQTKDEEKTTNTDIPKSGSRTIRVFVNREPIILSGKLNYVFVDVFDHINFDLSKPEGQGIVTNINGREAQYMEPLTDGDVLEIYWKK